MKRSDTDNYASLFLNNTPLMDTRAPVEFARGTFPTAVNLPLMDDQQREAVGISYKTRGQQAALALGYQLVSGEVLEQRRQAWVRFACNYPQGYLYCFRGGLRSQLVQQALADQGIDYPRVTGGYKAMRSYLLEQLRQLTLRTDFRVIAGRTGAGKTQVIAHFANSIDLENLANHRGSSFGYNLSPQPSQIDFENRLAISLLQRTQQFNGPVIIEDESNLIGRCALPDEIKQVISSQPILIVNSPLELRVRNIATEYISQPLQQYQEEFGPLAGWERFRQSVLASLDRIKRRLGGLRHQQLSAAFNSALDAHRNGQPVGVFFGWISTLLTDYYDPMYDYQLSKNQRPILFEGTAEQVIAALSSGHL